VPAGELAAALARCRKEPYAAKRALARDVVTQFHGAAAAARAEAHFDRLFKAKQAPAEMPAFRHAPGSLAAVLKDIGFAKSLGEARRMAAQGGVQLDGSKVEDGNRLLEPGSYVVKYGKLKFAELTIR
ncbi:MAG TPA: tyrosine--tRNA ligase, partial [Deltaproteobacteria bacterium]|nr:tyrosine--tRNA ligase [Deltaproteobacteria bacterium]